MPDEPKQIDTRIEIVTPENIAFDYHLAGPFRRLLAYIVDFAIRAAVIAVAAVILMCGLGMVMPGLGLAVLLLSYFALEWFYGGLFETFWNGQTPGKRLVRIRVTSITGEPIYAWQAILRNLARGADAMPFIFNLLPTFQLGLLIMICNARFQRLGDFVSGTMVVVEDPQRLYGVTPVYEPAAIELADYLPANYRASRSLARALSDYVQRRPSIAPPRRAEIARHVGEILRQKFELPPGTSHDLLLCALYYRTFIADLGDAERQGSPFAAAPAVAVDPKFVAGSAVSPLGELQLRG